MRRSELFFALAAIAAVGCPAPRAPIDDRSAPPMVPSTIEIGRDRGSLRAVAGDHVRTYAAIALASTVPAAAGAPGMSTTVIEARAGGALAWSAALDGSVTALARAGELLIATTSARGTATIAGAKLVLRGQPGTAIAGLDPATGDARWRATIDSNEWAEVTGLAATDGGDTIVGGTFAGTLRIGDKVVSSAGRTDGFVARMTPHGAPRWLIRVGGSGADGVQGVAVAGDRIAIAGIISVGAELLGEPLAPMVPRTPFADAFVAELDANGARVWATVFGGAEDDAVAGVAIDSAGHVAVAATVRGSVTVGTATLAARGRADGLVAWFTPTGAAGPATLIGGDQFDGLRAITAVDDRVVVAGFYAGQLQLGDRTLAAAGGDDAFVAALDATGKVVASWPIGGAGREEVTSLASVPGGWIAGVAHTAAATIDSAAVAAPHDPLAGAAIVVRLMK